MASFPFVIDHPSREEFSNENRHSIYSAVPHQPRLLSNILRQRDHRPPGRRQPDEIKKLSFDSRPFHVATTRISPSLDDSPSMNPAGSLLAQEAKVSVKASKKKFRDVCAAACWSFFFLLGKFRHKKCRPATETLFLGELANVEKQISPHTTCVRVHYYTRLQGTTVR